MADRVPHRVAEFFLERLDNELLLYHPGLAKAIQLNDTASLVWQLCDGERSVREIAELLVEAYPDNRETIAADVESAVRRFLDEGAVAFK